MWREWPQIDATEAKTLSDILMGVAQISGPQVDGETYAGVYSNADVIVVRDNRRSVTIRQKLIRLTTVLLVTDLPQPVDAGSASVLRPFEYDAGSDDVRIFEYRFLDRSSSEVCLSSIKDIDLALTNYTIIDRQWQTEPRGDRTCTFQVFQRKVSWSNSDEEGTDVKSIRTIGEEGYYAGVHYLKHLRRESETAYGVPLEDAANILNAWHADEDPDATGKATVNVAIQVRSNGEAYITRTIEYANKKATPAVSATAHGILLERQMFTGGGIPRRSVVLIPNVIHDVADALLATLRTATTITLDDTVYRNASVKRSVRPSGLCDITVEGKIATAGSVLSQYQDGSIADFTQQIVVDDDGARHRVTGQRLIVQSEASAVQFMNGQGPYNGATKAQLTRPNRNNLKQHLDGHMKYSAKMDRYICLRFVWASVEPTVGTFAVAPAVEGV